MHKQDKAYRVSIGERPCYDGNEVAMLTTWGTECGLAYWAKEVHPDVVVAEKILPPCTNGDTIANRTWSRNEKLNPSIISNGVKLLHINFEWGLLYQAGYLPFIEKLKKRKIKILLTLHSIYPRVPGAQWVYDFLLTADKIIVETEHMKATLQHDWGFKSTIIPLGAPKIMDRVVTEKPGSYGFITPNKGLVQLTQAIPKNIPFKIEGYPIVIPGNDVNVEYAKHINSLTKDTSIEFSCRWFTDNELVEKYSCADFVVLNYQGDIAGVSGCVAMAKGCGTPLIVSNSGMLSELQSDQCIRIKSSRELRDAISRLSKDEKAKESLSDAVRRNTITYDQVRMEYRYIYDSMLAE